METVKPVLFINTQCLLETRTTFLLSEAKHEPAEFECIKARVINVRAQIDQVMVEHANTAVLRQLCRVLSQTIPFQHILFYLIKVDLVHRLRLENMREVFCGLLHRAESRELSGDRRQHLSL